MTLHATFVIDCEVLSKKNGKVPLFRGGKLVGLMEAPRVQKSQKQVEAQLVEQASRKSMPKWTRETSLELAIVIDRDTGLTHIRVSPCGEEPKSGRNGRKRDIQNELALLCDALEKAGICENDSQFAKITIERVVQGAVR